MNIIPSNRGIKIGLPVLLVLGGLVWWLASASSSSMNTGNTRISVEEGSPLSEQVARRLSSVDTDKDGLLDWEETLWGTNSNNPDTDGDGTPDGEEVAAERDPRVAGPDDKLDITVFPDFTNEGEAGSLTLTSRLGRQFFVEYIESLESGGGFTSRDQEQLLSAVMSAAQEQGVLAFETYERADIETAAAPDQDTIAAYGNELGRIISRHSFETENELFILYEAFENEDPTELERLTPIARAYQNMVQDFLSVRVPQSAADSHIELINSAAAIATIIEEMQGILDDPLRGLLFVDQYKPKAQELQEAVAALDTFFQTNNVAFEQHEPGFLITATAR